MTKPMTNTALISHYIWTRLEQFGFPNDEIQWALPDVSSDADLDLVAMKDPIYPIVVRDRSYVAFYGDLKGKTLVKWAKESFILRDEDCELIGDAIEAGTVISLGLYNGAPSVSVRYRAKASYQEKAVIDTLVQYVTGKYNGLREKLGEEIKLIHEAGLHNKPLFNDTEVKQNIADIIYWLDKGASQAA